MSKQQDELREKIKVFAKVLNYDNKDTELVMQYIDEYVKSEVQAALDKVKMVDEIHWPEMNLDEVCGSYDEAFEQGGSKQRTKFIDVIEKVRKDYEQN